MGRTMLNHEQNHWEYGSPPSLIAWAESHVAVAVIGAAIAWFAVVYVLALVVGLFVGG